MSLPITRFIGNDGHKSALYKVVLDTSIMCPECGREAIGLLNSPDDEEPFWSHVCPDCRIECEGEGTNWYTIDYCIDSFQLLVEWVQDEIRSGTLDKWLVSSSPAHVELEFCP